MEDKVYLKLKEIRKDIDSIKYFNLPLIQEAMRQTELRIQDENNRKNRIDRRAYALLSLYTALFCGIIAINKFNGIHKDSMAIGIISILLIAMGGVFIILKSKKYAPLGTFPLTWLNKEFFTSHDDQRENDAMFGHVLCHILCDIQESLVISKDSNDKRIKLLDNILAISMLCILLVCYLIR